MNTRARFIIKRNSGAAVGLTVVTGDHMSIIGKFFKSVTDKDKSDFDVYHEYDRDIIVEEDVWIGSNVTLLKGAYIGRGAIIGSGTVVRSKIPPYSVVIGNPAKVINFRFNPQEIIEHELRLYDESERLSIDELKKNYDKYFLKRVKEIRNFIKL